MDSRTRHGEALVEALAERIGGSNKQMRIEVRYFAEYPQKVDRDDHPCSRAAATPLQPHA